MIVNKTKPLECDNESCYNNLVQIAKLENQFTEVTKRLDEITNILDKVTKSLDNQTDLQLIQIAFLAEQTGHVKLKKDSLLMNNLCAELVSMTLIKDQNEPAVTNDVSEKLEPEKFKHIFERRITRSMTKKD